MLTCRIRSTPMTSSILTAAIRACFVEKTGACEAAKSASNVPFLTQALLNSSGKGGPHR